LIDFDIDVTYQYRFEKDGTSHGGPAAWEWRNARYDDDAPGSAPAVDGSSAGIVVGAGVLAYNAASPLQGKTTRDCEAKSGKPRGTIQPAQAWAALSWVQVELGHNREAAEAAERPWPRSTDEAVLLARWQATATQRRGEAGGAEGPGEVRPPAEEAKRIHNEAVALSKAETTRGLAKFREALEVDPNIQESLLGLATALSRPARNDEGRHPSQRHLKTDPKNERRYPEVQRWLDLGTGGPSTR